MCTGQLDAGPIQLQYSVLSVYFTTYCVAGDLITIDLFDLTLFHNSLSGRGIILSISLIYRSSIPNRDAMDYNCHFMTKSYNFSYKHIRYQ